MIRKELLLLFPLISETLLISYAREDGKARKKSEGILVLQLINNNSFPLDDYITHPLGINDANSKKGRRINLKL